MTHLNTKHQFGIVNKLPMVEIDGIPSGMRNTPYDPSIIENFD